MKKSALVLLFCVGQLASSQTKVAPAISSANVSRHIDFLASDSLEGRKSGTKGGEMAAQYISSVFKAIGLKALDPMGTYFHPFEFTAGVILGPSNEMAYLISAKSASKETSANRRDRVSLKLDVDYRPVGFSASGIFSGPVVFVGYGIAATDKKYNDYDNIDVKGKAVIMLQFSPEGGAPHGVFAQYSSLRYKVAKARELGAKAVIVVTGPLDDEKDELVKLSYDQQSGNAGIPVVSIRRAIASNLLALNNRSLKEIQSEINTTKQPNSLSISNISISLVVDLQLVKRQAVNVAGLLEGSDGTFRHEVIVVGAHYDHLGMGGPGSGSLQPDTVAVHNGADDNASGTAGVLELARYFSEKRTELNRSILFLSFAGEEMGLLGSGAYVKNPAIPLDHSVAMLNMDMIGRLKDKKLIVYGVGTSSDFEAMARRHNADSTFDLRLIRDGFGPSDHSSFYAKKIPVFHFFTDLHHDYHRPGDDANKINAPGEGQILRYVAAIIQEIDTLTQRPSYAQMEMPKPAAGNAGRSGVRAYTGTIPDFGEEVAGMKLAGVREGGPAAKAGLLAGDIITRFGKVEIKNLQDYTYALGEYKAGEEVDVVVNRGNETRVFKLTLEKRSN